jgi:hypothetical protein
MYRDVDPAGLVCHVHALTEDGSEYPVVLNRQTKVDVKKPMPLPFTEVLFGTTTESPMMLKDVDGSDGWFFVFPDLYFRISTVIFTCY